MQMKADKLKKQGNMVRLNRLLGQDHPALHNESAGQLFREEREPKYDEPIVIKKLNIPKHERYPKYWRLKISPQSAQGSNDALILQMVIKLKTILAIKLKANKKKHSKRQRKSNLPSVIPMDRSSPISGIFCLSLKNSKNPVLIAPRKMMKMLITFNPVLIHTVEALISLS